LNFFNVLREEIAVAAAKTLAAAIALKFHPKHEKR
jgi:hypothetical protein